MLLADRLTRECTGKGRRRVAKERPKFTEIYKAYFFEDIMDMEEEELAEYIMENYDIPKGTKLNTVWDVVSEQVTATHITQELLWDLKEVYRETDISIGIKNWTKGGHGSIDFRKDKDFMKILEKMRARLQIKKTRKEWLDEQLAAGGLFQDLNDPTRLELITACFYRYYFSERGRGLSLPRMIEDFCFEVDPLLEKCRYQKISTKNIFDMFALFMLYSISA